MKVKKEIWDPDAPPPTTGVRPPIKNTVKTGVVIQWIMTEAIIAEVMKIAEADGAHSRMMRTK